MQRILSVAVVLIAGLVILQITISGQKESVDVAIQGTGHKKLFDHETFGGNGRTCLTWHSADTGTVSPEDARRRFEKHPTDPLFLHDGSDDGRDLGVSRMLRDATILVEISQKGSTT